MQKSLFYTLMFLIVFLLPLNVMADRYVRKGGSNSGTNWTTAYPLLATAEANATGGETIWVADGDFADGRVTYNSSHGTNVITIKKATIAEHGTETGWDDSYGDGQASLSGITFDSDYWHLDGSTRTTISSGHGFTLGPHGGQAIRMQASNITISYLEVEGGGDDGDGPGNDLIYSLASHDNVTLEYSYFHDSGRTMILSRGGTGWIVQHNYWYKNESVAAEHSEMWSTGSNSNMVIRYNIFELWEGTGCIARLDSSGTGNWEIYGNVFMKSPSGSGNGVITTDSDSTLSDVEVYNNVFYDNGQVISIGPGGGGSGSGWIVRNNIFLDNWRDDSTACSISGTASHNWYYNNLCTPPSQTARQDASADPFTNADGYDFTLTGATDAGFDTGAAVAGNDTDPDGVTRGADGNWDRGAYEFGTPTNAITGVNIN